MTTSEPPPATRRHLRMARLELARAIAFTRAAQDKLLLAADHLRHATAQDDDDDDDGHTAI